MRLYCPRCLVEYRAGFTHCEDCDVPLVPGAAPGPDDVKEPTFDALIRTGISDPVAIGLVESLLREAEIPFFRMDRNTAARQESGNVLGWWNIRVPAEFEAETREIVRSVEETK